EWELLLQRRRPGKPPWTPASNTRSRSPRWMGKSVLTSTLSFASVAKPGQRRLPTDEPLGREHGRSLICLGPRSGEIGRPHEGELADTGGAVARDDVGVAPFHHARSEGVLELGRVDEQERGPRLLRLSGEEAQRRHETTVRHAGGRGEPAQLEEILVLDHR